MIHGQLEARERQVYEEIWAVEAYGQHSPGEAYVDAFLAMSGAIGSQSVLDAGCGSGKGALALRSKGFVDVRLCDLTADGLVDDARSLPFTEACLWHHLSSQLGYLAGGKVDYVYCCDVLEHIPTAFTMLVVSRLLEVARRGVFLSIALVPDVFGAWVGTPLHQTVESFVWWRDHVKELGHLVECRDYQQTGLYLVEPR